MVNFIYSLLCLMVLFVICSCSRDDDKTKSGAYGRQPKGEYIYRKHDEHFFAVPLPERNALPIYPWNKQQNSPFPVITKEYFRCRGDAGNPKITITQNGETRVIYDCGGVEKHSLPLRDGREFVYPILIELLNYVQETTQKKVVITSGHRCPEHNTYVDIAIANSYSKHTICAEVSFYVEGMESHPEQIATIIQEFYTKDKKYNQQKPYIIFQRYDKGTQYSAILPWYNKEIFIKIYGKSEGRNFDNKHPYPYISLQVRHDRDKNEAVTYSWDKAFRNFYRY